jgi:hypothetical protein
MTKMLTKQLREVGVVYLCRGMDEGWMKAAESFLKSYKEKEAGIDHNLYVVIKGFQFEGDQNAAIRLFKNDADQILHYEDDGFDIMAYIRAAEDIHNNFIFFLNGHSKILRSNWLKYMFLNITRENIFLVGATGSFESIDSFTGFPRFPNPHIRSNAFMIRRDIFLGLTKNVQIKDKVDAYRLESGEKSLTRLAQKLGEVLVVGANGRGYEPKFWHISETFKSGKQQNLMVSDNQTERYIQAPWPLKDIISLTTWRMKKKLLKIV